jgi:uncharacterized membrane-anchored protein YhcB (DUF1043 family)
LSAGPAECGVSDWLYPILLAIVGAIVGLVSSLVVAYFTNRSADQRQQKALESAERRSKMELRARTYESLLSDRRNSLLEINHTMTRYYYILLPYSNTHFRKPPETPEERNREFKQKIEGISEKFREDVARSVWVDKELIDNLWSVLGCFQEVEREIGRLVREGGVSRLTPEDGNHFIHTFWKAKEHLQRVLGVQRVESYFNELLNQPDIKKGPL